MGVEVKRFLLVALLGVGAVALLLRVSSPDVWHEVTGP